MLEVVTETGRYECRELRQVTGTYHMKPPYTAYCDESKVGKEVKKVESSKRVVSVYPYSDRSGKMRCNSVVQNDGDLMCIGDTGMEKIRTSWNRMR